jgi:hypothetical protein
MLGNSGIALTTFTNAGSEDLYIAHHSAPMTLSERTSLSSERRFPHHLGRRFLMRSLERAH